MRLGNKMPRYTMHTAQATISADYLSGARQQLRGMLGPWAFAALVPLPDLVTGTPAECAVTACVYLGLMNGWLVTEFYRQFGRPANSAEFLNRTVAISLALSVNVALFIFCGECVEVETTFPFYLMAGLSVLPALGIVPFAIRVMRESRYIAIILTGLTILACKLAGCVAARFVYGPDYIAQGYVSSDWRTAKLMISLMWIFSTFLSLAAFACEWRRASVESRVSCK